MKTKLFSIYDSKTEAYAQPFHAMTAGAAIRMVTDEANTPTSSLNRHAADYTLFELGEYDDATGKFTFPDAKINLGNIQEYINQ